MRTGGAGKRDRPGPAPSAAVFCPGSIVAVPPWLEPLLATVVPPTQLHEARDLPPRRATASLQHRVQQTPCVLCPCPIRSTSGASAASRAGATLDRGDSRIKPVSAVQCARGATGASALILPPPVQSEPPPPAPLPRPAPAASSPFVDGVDVVPRPRRNRNLPSFSLIFLFAGLLAGAETHQQPADHRADNPPRHDETNFFAVRARPDCNDSEQNAEPQCEVL